MRQFSLENIQGETFSLNDDSAFLHSPAGLGFSRDIEFQRMGIHHGIVSDGFSQKSISGSVCFSDDSESSAYEKYAAFARFLQFTPLILHYTTDRHYKIDVMPSTIEKTEIEALGLDVSVDFTAISLFYEDVEAAGTSEVIIRSDSAIISPCKLRLGDPSGSSVAFTWSQYVDDTLVMQGGVSTSKTCIEVRSDSTQYQIVAVTANGAETDIYAYSDFSKGRFPYIYPGVNRFVNLNATNTAIKVTGRIEYATV